MEAFKILENIPHGQEGFFWGEGLKNYVQKFVSECLVCQQNKGETIKTPGLLQPLAIPSQRWEEVSMDFITGLPKLEGKTIIMVVMDLLTNYAHFCSFSSFFSKHSSNNIHGNSSKTTWSPQDYCK
jgi:hypothetical protein